MPDESQNQNPTGDQTGEGQVQDQQTNEHKGGPSDIEKMKRLERELAEAKEREAKYRSAYEGKQTQTNDSNDDDNDDQFSQERDSFYKEKAASAAISELGAEIEKLPKALQDRVKNDPFNPAWTDPQVLEYELIGVDLNDPKAKMEAAKRAAIKSIPKFVEGFVEKKDEGSTEDGLGNNPPLDQGNVFNNGGEDMALMSDEELRRIANMGRK